MRHTFYAALIVTILSVSSFFSVLAASEQDPTSIPNTNEKITIDARLEESVWRSAAHFTLDYETQPAENIPAPVATDVWIAHDKTNVYFALHCHDPEPDAIRAWLSDRDNIFNDDIIYINLDTFNDERRSYFFGVNPLGLQRDGIETSNTSDASWDAIWDSAARIVDDGYIIEMAIPFACIQIQNKAGAQVWGLDISRWYPRNETHRIGLVPIDRNIDRYQGQFLKISGFENVDPGRNIEVTPTVVASSTDVRPHLSSSELENVSQDVEAGASLRWGITPNFILNGTVNPDFSQVEADARQLDINTRFALSFQEKRPFFTEGFDFFQTQMDAVYTRTMHDPNVGIKLTGKESGNNFGAYAVQDDVTNLIFPGSQGSRSTSLLQESNIGIFRYKRDLGTRTTIGALLTTRNGDDYYNHVYGVDGTVRIDDRNRIDFQYLGSSTEYPEFTAEEFGQPDGEFSDDALYLRYLYASRHVSAYARYQEYGNNFRSDLGFIPQVGYKEFYSGAEYRWISNEAWWNQIQIRGEFLGSEEENGTLLQRISAFTLSVNGVYQSNLLAYVGKGTENFAGTEYDLTEYYFRAYAQPVAGLSLNSNMTIGDAIDYSNNRLGSRINLYMSGSYRFGRHVNWSISHRLERFDVDDDDLYSADITQSTFIYHFNARLFARAILQYVDYTYNVDNYFRNIEPENRQLFSQFLLSYELNPTTVLYLGYTDSYRGDSRYDLTQTDRTFFMKVGYTLQY